MKSINFPKMFNTSSSIIISDKEATMNNLKLLLLSDTNNFGDPYFGLNLKKYYYEQNNHILMDICIDDIYTKISLFMPQIFVKREDIILTRDKSKIRCYIKVKNVLDYQVSIYELVLFDLDDTQKM